RRSEHQGSNRAALRRWPANGQPLKRRQRESRRLACAGLGTTQYIAAGKNVGNCRRLNRSGGRVIRLAHGAKKGFRQFQNSKTHDTSKRIDTEHCGGYARGVSTCQFALREHSATRNGRWRKGQ